MLEVLQFIFSSFWVWAGCTFMLAMIASIVTGLAAALRGNSKEPGNV